MGSIGNPMNRGLWDKWNTDFGHSWTVDSGNPDVTINGNVLFDGASLNVKANMTVHGNAVFDGVVEVTSGWYLSVSNTSSSPGWAFFRAGSLSEAEARASLSIRPAST